MESEKLRLKCPVCGSTDVASAMATDTIDVPFLNSETIAVFQDTCSKCGEVGDFSDRNDAIIEAALERLNSRSVEENLGFLSSLGLTMAYIERALELPQRTLMRWKAGEHSASAVALLRMVRAYPWILKVAERGFEEKYARFVVVEQAATYLYTSIETVLSSQMPNTVIGFGIIITRSELPFNRVQSQPISISEATSSQSQVAFEGSNAIG